MKKKIIFVSVLAEGPIDVITSTTLKKSAYLPVGTFSFYRKIIQKKKVMLK